MQQFVYDGTYSGLFTTIFEIYDRRCDQACISKKYLAQESFFSDTIHVTTDQLKAERVWKGLKNKLSAQSFNNIYWAFLSELKGIENTILQFVKYVFSGVKNAETNYGHSAVLDIAQTARRVGREKHRMEAFVRFENIGNRLFYAPIDPDFNVLPLIISHFKQRYADQSWIIYDTKRNYGAYYDCNSEQVSEMIIDFEPSQEEDLVEHPLIDPHEKLYQDLWKNYFKNVNIPSRKNTKLHLKHLPKRYWRYLVEKHN